jgi:DNA primase
MEKMMCADAKQLDLVDYLASLGHQPAKVRNQDYWYLSPFREEKTPSFKVNRPLNVWYDHSTGKGGDLVDFGTQYHKCTVRELLDRLSEYRPGNSLSFQQPSLPDLSSSARSSFAGEKKESPDSKIVIVDTRPLADQTLLAYLEKRCIPLNIADRFCREVDFLLYGKKHTVIGFPNKSGGYELRNEHFKGSSAPKDITFLDNRTEGIVVFEGFFSFLSFQTINKNLQAPLTNCLILNSLSFFEKSRPLMEKYHKIHLLLDRDTAGRNYTTQALRWNPDKYIDRSEFYERRKDLNEWLLHRDHSLRIGQKIGRRL